MDTSALLTRYSWPGLSLLMGLVLGGISNTGPAPAAKEKAPATMTALEGRNEPSGISASSAPPTATSAALPAPWPDHVTRQMVDPNYLDHARMIWVPSELAEILRWKLGHFDKGIKLSPEAKALLELNEAEALQVENTIDDFVRGIRDIEQRNSTLLEKTQQSVTVSLPAGLTPNGPFQQLQAELLPLLGPVKFRSLYVQLTASLRQSSAIMSGRKMILTAKLLEEGKIHIRMEMQGGANTTTTSIPMNLWHLLPPIVGTGRNRSWR